MLRSIADSVRDFINTMRVRFLQNMSSSDLDSLNYTKATMNLIKAKEIDKNNSVTYYLLGLTEARQENYNNAIEYLKKSVELNPNSTQYKFDLALCYMENGDYKESEIMLKKILADYPEDQSLHLYVCELYHRKSDVDKAIELIEKFDYESRVEPKLVFQLAKYYKEKGMNNKKILEVLNEAKEKSLILKNYDLIKEIEEFENDLS